MNNREEKQTATLQAFARRRIDSWRHGQNPAGRCVFRAGIDWPRVSLPFIAAHAAQKRSKQKHTIASSGNAVVTSGRQKQGCLVEPESAEALTAPIETLYSDAELRMRLTADVCKQYSNLQWNEWRYRL